MSFCLITLPVCNFINSKHLIIPCHTLYHIKTVIFDIHIAGSAADTTPTMLIEPAFVAGSPVFGSSSSLTSGRNTFSDVSSSLVLNSSQVGDQLISWITVPVLYTGPLLYVLFITLAK